MQAKGWGVWGKNGLWICMIRCFSQSEENRFINWLSLVTIAYFLYILTGAKETWWHYTPLFSLTFRTVEANKGHWQMEVKTSALWLLKLLDNVIQMQPRCTCKYTCTTYSKLPALSHGGMEEGLWIFRRERERKDSSCTKPNLLSEERFSGGENKKRIVEKESWCPYWRLPHGNGRGKIISAKIFPLFQLLTIIYRNVCWRRKCLIFQDLHFHIDGRDFSPCLGRKLLEYLWAFLTPSSSPVLPKGNIVTHLICIFKSAMNKLGLTSLAFSYGSWALEVLFEQTWAGPLRLPSAQNLQVD